MKNSIFYKIIILGAVTIVGIGIGYSVYGVKFKLFHLDVKIEDNGSLIIPQKYTFCNVDQDCAIVDGACSTNAKVGINKQYQRRYVGTMKAECVEWRENYPGISFLNGGGFDKWDPVCDQGKCISKMVSWLKH